MFFEGKRLLVGAEDEIIKTCELLEEKKYTGKVKEMLTKAVENTEDRFIITDELLASLKKRKKIIDDVLAKKKYLSHQIKLKATSVRFVLLTTLKPQFI
ncbi:MAG: hypothetical protein KIS94_05170 [Chitinophagales bacterium]|nr:hypothetical protein [Chitinophagales bacterium]